MLNVLLVFVIIQFVLLFGVIGYLWNQFNNTDSKLMKLFKDKIELDRVSHEQDHILSIDDIEKD